VEDGHKGITSGIRWSNAPAPAVPRPRPRGTPPIPGDSAGNTAFRAAEEVVLPMQTAGMEEPEQPKQIRLAIVDDIVWVLVHSSGDVDVAALVLQLCGASEAEFDLAVALAQQRLHLPG
jgi:hypothetical protein